MADKQTGTGARGRRNKTGSGGNDQEKNPVSARNQSKQKKDMNRSGRGGDVRERGQGGRT